MSRAEALLNKMARRAATLLKDSPDPQQEMEWAEKRLSEEGLLGWSRRIARIRPDGCGK